MYSHVLLCSNKSSLSFVLSQPLQHFMGCYMLTKAQWAQLQKDFKLFFFPPNVLTCWLYVTGPLPTNRHNKTCHFSTLSLKRWMSADTTEPFYSVSWPQLEIVKMYICNLYLDFLEKNIWGRIVFSGYYRCELFQGLLVSLLALKSVCRHLCLPVCLCVHACLPALHKFVFHEAFIYFVVLCLQCRRILGVCIRSVR